MTTPHPTPAREPSSSRLTKTRATTEVGTGAGATLLRLEDVIKDYPGQRKAFAGRSEPVRAVDGVSLEVTKGETLGLVGETGCGKSTLARCIARLTDVTSGRIQFEGRDITRLSGRGLRAMRSDIQMIFQDPYGSLNPRRRVGSIIGDPFAIHHIASGRERRVKVQELMELVGLNPEHYNRFPAEFSGGQRQRIGVARALALRPKLIICDEPVSALDVSIQAQILNLLGDLQRELDLTYVFISHDLSVVRHVSSRIAVMYRGKVVELAPTEPLYAQPRHPYTHALRSAIPLPDPDAADQREVLVLPDIATTAAPPKNGCVFSPRCSRAQDECLLEAPPLIPRLADPASHVAACIYPMESEAIAESRVAPAARRSRTPQERPNIDTDDPAPVQSAESPAADARPGEVPPGHTVVANTASDPPPAAARIRARGPWRLAFERLRRDRAAIISGVVIVLVILLAICAPLVAAATGHGNLEQFPKTGRTVDGLPVGPNSTFLLGTDDLGRDLLVRIAYGARISLLVGVLATVLTVIIGVIIGLAAGYLGSIVDSILARLIDVMLSIPFLLFAISLASVYHTGLTIVIIVLAVFSWSAVARVVRGQVLSIREREYVEAARSLGAGSRRIMFTDILPNVMAPIIVYTTLLIPISIVGAATLSFLGVGVQPPTADWGAMLSSASQLYQHAWWFLVFPGLALFITTVAFNVFGDGVRDAVDPRSHEIVRGGTK
jgi:oligopeptide/dipeptide ABC transporter ATP-binding protein